MLDQLLEHVLCRQPHGRCFIIHKPREFVDQVMPQYFRQSKLTSFQRFLTKDKERPISTKPSSSREVPSGSGFNGLNIKRLNEINCHRGKRHRNSLPVRGQRTRTNARPRRGAKKTVTDKSKKK